MLTIMLSAFSGAYLESDPCPYGEPARRPVQEHIEVQVDDQDAAAESDRQPAIDPDHDLCRVMDRNCQQAVGGCGVPQADCGVLASGGQEPGGH